MLQRNHYRDISQMARFFSKPPLLGSLVNKGLGGWRPTQVRPRLGPQLLEFLWRCAER